MSKAIRATGGFFLFFLFGVSLYELWVEVGPATSFTMGMWILYSRGLGQKMTLMELAFAHLACIEDDGK
jgi:hypothetical protein